MKKEDCHYYYFGNDSCERPGGGVCARKCKEFISEKQWIEQIDEKETCISLVKLRDILEFMRRMGYLNEYSSDYLMEQIKRQL